MHLDISCQNLDIGCKIFPLLVEGQTNQKSNLTIEANQIVIENLEQS